MIWNALWYTAAACGIIAVGASVQHGNLYGAAGLGMVTAELIMRGATGRHVPIRYALLDGLITAALAASAAPDGGIWQAPLLWSDVFAITAPAAAIAAMLYFSLCAFLALSAGRHIRLTGGFSLLLIPYLFNALLLLQSPGLLADTGRAVTFGGVASLHIAQWIGSAAVLALVNEATAALLCLTLAGRFVTDRRMHCLLLGSAVFAAVTPRIADIGSGTAVSGLTVVAGHGAALAAAVLCAAGLWAQTFLVTGMLMDALHGKPPLWYWGRGHFTEGLIKGGIYTFVFFGILYGIAGVIAVPGMRTLCSLHPLLTGAVAGTLLFPLLKTIIESFDGSLPFFTRLRNNYSRFDHWLRGSVVGVGIAWALRDNLAAAEPGFRFLCGFGIGATAYGGANIMRDCLQVLALHRRLRLQSVKIYLFEALMGGLAGGALAWYFDAQQTVVVAEKFHKYTALFFGTTAIPIEDYVIYPLCSKWGAMNLGPATGGVRLFYSESLSGVINWSLAAPLFSINVLLLTALLRGNAEPLRNLFSRQGLAGLVEQAFRVQRWGLWMAPVIYSFLRISPTPTWYNQDGAVRTAVAAVKCLTATPSAFHAWSLSVFTDMLTYDWLRIAIYIDHMGLRVATLVNFSFIGMDVLDEKIARLFGHSVRARVIPQGLRRFVTWAPLLIPFYLPRGEDWNRAWHTAEQLSRSHPAALFTPAAVATAAALIAFCIGAAMLQRSRTARTRIACVAENDEWFEIGNGLYTLRMGTDGRSFSRVYSQVRRGSEIDLTRRPHDPLQRRGKFFYFQDYDDPRDVWSLTREPAGAAGQDAVVHKRDRLSFVVRTIHGDIRAEAVARIDSYAPLETWTISLRNTGNARRTFRVVSYQEFALNAADAYLRHPEYNSLHVGTWFVPGLNAIIASNRLLKRDAREPLERRLSGEVAFHAVGETPGSTVLLTGYEDSRYFFIGAGSPRRPDGLLTTPRSLADDGLLYTFDPAASLTVHVTLGPGQETTIVFADGYAPDIRQAQELLRKSIRLPVSEPRSVAASLQKSRVLHGFGAPGDADRREDAAPHYDFSADGTELRTGVGACRPLTHVIANRHGYGMVMHDQGELFSFMGNSQQNGLTPFSLNAVPAEIPGQVVYLYNTKTGAVDGPTHIPWKRSAAACSVVYGRGYAVFTKKRRGLEQELVVFALPDAPAELRILTVRNTSSRDAVFRVVPYLQVVLGETPQDTRGMIIAEYDEASQALLFTNPSNQFYRGFLFVAMSLTVESFTTSRARFLGSDCDFTVPHMVRHGTPDLSVPAGEYAAAALAGTLQVPAGAERTVVLVIGQPRTRDEAIAILTRYRDPAAAREAYADTRQWWAERLSVLRVRTNQPNFDRLVNDWLPYQVFTAHLWGRVGPNQRSGGYGYRDQLQAALPLLYLDPAIARDQILLHAGQQFYQGGDVLQWWHQSWEGKSGLGARNRASDPHLWLPYLVYQYVAATGDHSILDEKISFLERRRIPRDREGVMFAPRPAPDSAPLYLHCVKAIELTLDRLGGRGLPLIGTGDWNDGLSLVGHQGRGESVWLGFFLYAILTGFAPLVEAREGAGRARYYRAAAERLRQALDAQWRDGRYVRAITDDGRDMLFADALIGAWPAISGAADFEHATAALQHGLRDLEKEEVVLLLWPPFTERSDPYPGKIADYPPGVRENGGQYSHGVSWLVDGLVRIAAMAEERGDPAVGGEFRGRAFEIWEKISPLSHTAPHRRQRYGLPPHQQAADVYYGYGYAGRGGWSWYTGAAARMLFAAYQMLGITMQDGRLQVARHVRQPIGRLHVRSVVYKGREFVEG